MEKQMRVDPKGLRELSSAEMQTCGGGLTQYVIQFAIWGAGYFYRMGVQEGRRTKASI
jgi:hypothetical protein